MCVSNIHTILVMCITFIQKNLDSINYLLYLFFNLIFLICIHEFRYRNKKKLKETNSKYFIEIQNNKISSISVHGVCVHICFSGACVHLSGRLRMNGCVMVKL